jgi:hypothetical protein
MSDYVATCEIETISFSGEGATPELAMEDFLSNGEFEQYCECQCIKSGEIMTVRVYESISSEEMDYEEKEMAESYGWDFATRGQPVIVRQVEYRVWQ